MERLYRVAANSHPMAVAGAIAAGIREGDTVVLQAIGAGAVNQAVKAIAIARGYLVAEGLDIICAPMFVVLEIDGAERTALQFHVGLPGHDLPAVSGMAEQTPPAA